MILRILQVIPHYVPAYAFGGPLRVAHPLGMALVKLGHELVVCTTSRADHIHDLDVLLDEPVVVDGVTVYYEPVHFLRYWGYSRSLWSRVRTEVAQADLVLIHAHFQFANWAGAYWVRRLSKPYIVYAHGSLHQAAISNKSYWQKKLYLNLLERRNFQQALFIAFNAPEEKAQSLWGKMGRVIPSGINPTEFQDLPVPGYFRAQYSQLADKTYLLSLGRLDVEQKGLDLLLEAFAPLVQNRPDLHLVLAGPNEDGGQAALQQMADAWGITDHIIFTGLITGKDKLAALQDADIFVLPSRFEGLSIALLEALYMGIPMLVTDRVGLSRQIAERKAGIMVPLGVDEIRRGLQQLIDPTTRNELHGNGTVLIQEAYTWDTIAKQFMEMMQSEYGIIG